VLILVWREEEHEPHRKSGAARVLWSWFTFRLYCLPLDPGCDYFPSARLSVRRAWAI